MTEDMFGGLHRNDEMKRAEQSGWSRKKTKSADRNKGLAPEALLRSLDGCHWVSRNSPQSALDTADFVRHVPELPGHISLVQRSGALWHSAARFAPGNGFVAAAMELRDMEKIFMRSRRGS